MKVKVLKINGLHVFDDNEAMFLNAYLNSAYNTVEEANQNHMCNEAVEALIDLKRVQIKIAAVQNAAVAELIVNQALAQITERDRAALELTFDLLDRDFKNKACDYNYDTCSTIKNKIFGDIKKSILVGVVLLRSVITD